MIQGKLLAVLLGTPLFVPGDPIVMVADPFKGCTGKVIGQTLSPSGNFYDVEFFKCPNMWIKGSYTEEDIKEEDLRKLENK